MVASLIVSGVVDSKVEHYKVLNRSQCTENPIEISNNSVRDKTIKEEMEISRIW